MSGGVDSSVAAALIKDMGYDCIGGTMKLFSHACVTDDDVRDAQKIAEKLGFPHFTFNFSGDFEKCVINRFVEAYEKGATPNPCVDCNRYIKFASLLEKAKELGCDYIVTGHYARIEKCGDRFLLKKGLDESKDQSYVLYSLTQYELSHTLLPLGSLSKDEVRELAENHGFVNASKKDSQDICFVPDGDYASFIERFTGKNYPKGDFVDKKGNVLGTHRGIIRYTVGQRKGLGLALLAPMYVMEKDIENNKVILASNDELFKDELYACDFNWIAENPETEFIAYAKPRYRAKEAKARIIPLEHNRVHIIFDEPQRAITRGQAVVVYDGDTVIGGGTIE